MARVIFLICALVAGFHFWNVWHQEHIVGKSLPFERTLLDGSQFRLVDHLGEVVVINFWASWCAPCAQEMPIMEAYYEKHHDQGLILIAVSSDQPQTLPDAIRQMHQYSFPMGLPRTGSGSSLGFTGVVPRTIVIDRSGVIRAEWNGSIQPDEAARVHLEQVITPLLGTAAPRVNAR